MGTIIPLGLIVCQIPSREQRQRLPWYLLSPKHLFYNVYFLHLHISEAAGRGDPQMIIGMLQSNLQHFSQDNVYLIADTLCLMNAVYCQARVLYILHC